MHNLCPHNGCIQLTTRTVMWLHICQSVWFRFRISALGRTQLADTWNRNSFHSTKPRRVFSRMLTLKHTLIYDRIHIFLIRGIIFTTCFTRLLAWRCQFHDVSTKTRDFSHQIDKFRFAVQWNLRCQSCDALLQITGCYINFIRFNIQIDKYLFRISLKHNAYLCCSIK